MGSDPFFSRTSGSDPFPRWGQTPHANTRASPPAMSFALSAFLYDFSYPRTRLACALAAFISIEKSDPDRMSCAPMPMKRSKYSAL